LGTLLFVKRVAQGLAVVVLLAAPAGVQAGSLPEVPSGARPGPDLLYAPAVDAPQLQNAAPWTAPPILVSGAQAYRRGEFLYQDFLFDDHGAAGNLDPTDPFSEVENMFAPKRGTLTYPTGTATYANNAADLVELRIKPLRDATAIRVTLNTLKAAGKTAFTVAIGDSDAPRPWPHGAGVSSPAQYFLTVHGNSAELLDAGSGAPVTPAPSAVVDMTRRQIDVRIPHAAWNPGTATVRFAAGAGLWDGDSYATPGAVASATAPGGSNPAGAALFNIAFRATEPVPHINFPGVANTIVEGHVGVVADGSWWRERRQADVLASGDVSSFSARVDFAKLAKRADDDSGVPQRGHIDRIFASRYEFGQGVDYDQKCILSLVGSGTDCTGRQVGRLQPYGLYVPDKPLPAKGYGLVVSMHGLSANYNEFLGSVEAEQLGERGGGSIIAAPEGRGPDGSYKSYAEADVFEMWADVARNYRLDPELTDVSGYSMGGGGTYRLASRWPDLWARAFPIVGPPTSAETFKVLRNIPIMAWYAQTDELVGPEMSEEAYSNAQGAGIRYDHWVFVPAGHITIGNNDEFAPAAAFLGDHRVDRDPAHVTYVVDPGQDSKAQSPADHAYWLSGMSVRTGGAIGTVDARSRGKGVGDAPVLAPAYGAGTLNGGSHGPLPYTRRTLAWGPVPATAKANEIELVATNVAALTIDAPRAGVGCDAKVNVTSDGPVKVTIGGCDVVAALPKGRASVGCVRGATLRLRLPRTLRGRRVVSAAVAIGEHRARAVRKPFVVRLSLQGVPKRFSVRIVARLSTGRRVVTTRRYRRC